VTPGAEIAVGLLETLAGELAGLGWDTRLRVQAGQPPGLAVAHPAAGPGQHIRAGCWHGRWWYWWPWDEPIARDPGEAAALISRALRSAAPAPARP
jgi:hypothetical protein